jgi:hypothetical protein
MLKRLPGWFIVLSLLGCATGSTLRVTPEVDLSSAAAKSASDVKLFITELPPVPFKSVALLRADQSNLLPDERDAVLGKLLDRAGELGCDGLIVRKQDKLLPVTGPSRRNHPDVLEVVRATPGGIADLHEPVAPYWPEQYTIEGYLGECVVWD